MMFFEQLKLAAKQEWQAYTQHEFVRLLAKGTLEKESFQHYLKQDYLFLLHFTRAWGLAIYKSHSFAQMRYAQTGINALLDTEIGLHIDYCKEWGITEEQLLQEPESSACVAYTRYVLDCGLSGSLPELYTALMPCLVGYAETVEWLLAQPFTIEENNPYYPWIAMYSSKEYTEAVEIAKQQFECMVSGLTPAQQDKLIDIFKTATRMEVAFWEMGLHQLA
ncbi:thiaminase II [Pelistega sp. NLN82]|uniref:Aminopyrimidine aminohydrolase n=1 Tax=Pelistega ratti TaxID=2652177 RepID=A0A6L9Y352_9BURK|nr:thiaminase II [Pelistega ratti]NEN74800.1 thiaminase II [Pelistega ratti]